MLVANSTRCDVIKKFEWGSKTLNRILKVNREERRIMFISVCFVQCFANVKLLRYVINSFLLNIPHGGMFEYPFPYHLQNFFLYGGGEGGEGATNLNDLCFSRSQKAGLHYFLTLILNVQQNVPNMCPPSFLSLCQIFCHYVSCTFTKSLAYGKKPVFGQNVFNTHCFECTCPNIRIFLRHLFDRRQRLIMA